MPNITISGKHRRRVRFPTGNRLVSQPAQDRQERSPQKPKSSSRLVELPSDDQGQGSPAPNSGNMASAETSSTATASATAQNQGPNSSKDIPALFTEQPAIRDPLVTKTSELQDSTVEECLPYLKGIASDQDGPFNRFGVPRLNRDYHIDYLYDALEDYPGKFVGLDSSRPWMVYWALTAMYLLGEDVTQFRERCV